MRDVAENIVKRAKFINTLLDHFWKRWSREYLSELREHQNCRNKVPGHQVQAGDVAMTHDNLPRNRWKLGLVIELYEGKDGFKRGCKLRTITKTGRASYLNRPINKLYALEIPSERTIKTNDNEVGFNQSKINADDQLKDEISNELDSDEKIDNLGKTRIF